MQGHYQPYAPMPGPPPGPPRRDRANLVPLFILVGVLVVALLGTLAFVLVKTIREDDGEGALPERTIPGPAESTPLNPRAVTAAFAGTWSGAGYYHNNDSEKRNFDATITLTEGSESGTSSYTGFVCSGTLRVESVTPSKIIMHETITQGQETGGNCEDVPTGYVTLTPRGDGSVLYSWFGTREKMLANNTSSQATLTRSGTGGTTT
ncbi:hypothetical protein [Thermomonospora umbrina]|uniref:Uncharacterized protein n=1 Tax=Thermomonospora umbrina TaxID=111806 RepID=A0A3D9SK92_9ACTN|nr:hypothetical protein [Thermomonospora umbrina]REE96346.1 hypothetical protein DFJ69_1776 [Thermomonospora umbrina]